jgi:hypothetical protein
MNDIYAERLLVLWFLVGFLSNLAAAFWFRGFKNCFNDFLTLLAASAILSFLGFFAVPFWILKDRLY